jgi:hypothetical protein
MSKLLIEGITAIDEKYNWVRDLENSQCIKARKSVENLWQRFEQYADPHFKTEIQKDFDARYWEMYLTCSIDDAGYLPSCPKPGPDVQIKKEENIIWFEAIAPSGGQTDNPDKVPDYEFGTVRSVPDREITLRLCSAIKEKYNNKYWKYREKKIINETDVYVIAITGCKINYANKEREIPRIIRSVFPIGNLQVSVDQNTFEFSDTSYAYEPEISKISGSRVSTSIFMNKKYYYLSAVLYSNVNAVNAPKISGSDYVIVHNPHAVNILPRGFFKRGLEYTTTIKNGEYKLNYHNWNNCVQIA